MLAAFTAGRRVHSISTDDVIDFTNLTRIDLGTLGPHFGSGVMVKTVEWKKCLHLDDFLDYMIAQNPGV